MPPLRALELLDFNYADRAVRKFAVDCLSKISDLDLCQYLLQLVQVLKYESYIESHLVQFLLQRALRSQRVGHIFFWLLKSEMHVQSVSVRYGLILEAYCHGSIGHVKLLSKQVAALDKLASCCLNIKEENIANAAEKKAALEKMRKVLAQKSFSEVLSDIPSSLDPSYRLKGLRRYHKWVEQSDGVMEKLLQHHARQYELQNWAYWMDKCKFMDSKKRPLWLVWVNQDEDAPDVFMMYKKGDDLRQDMLTLQILRVIDSLWQEEGLDLRMNTYGCLATGHEEGLIEIVLESDTIANIQKKNALAMTAAFKKDSLWKWLHEHHKDSHSMDKAIEEFTLSCAGYCVATYVLGIGDRHNDNIMLKKNGQMFHIDFGHFLGNFKSKLGVRRERVPFVITNDFMYIIKRGPENSEQAMERFSKLCVDAFMILRRHSHFLLSLFMMMMNTGIPQLSSVNDILYLRNTLRPHESEEVARVSFQEKFNEAIKGSWKPALNFTAHIIARDNT